MKTSLVFALLIAAGAAMYLPTQAMAAVNLDIAVGAPPPPQRTEVVPPPRPGFAWIPGFWDWSGSTYVWLPGHWEPAREGFVYEAPVWGHSPDGWHLHRGGWREGRAHGMERDRIGDQRERHAFR